VKRADVAIVGAGTAGAAAAALCAQRGMSVVCIERRPLDEAGARWCERRPLLDLRRCWDRAAIGRGSGSRTEATSISSRDGAALFRRFAQSLDAAELAKMMRAGLLTESPLRAGLEQRWPTLSPRDVVPIARGVLREPRLARRLAPVLVRMPALQAIYMRYPRRSARMRPWTRMRDRIVPAM